MSIIEAPNELIGAVIAAVEDDGYQSVKITLEDGRIIDLGTCSCCGLDCTVEAAR